RTLLHICSRCLATIVACAWTAVHPDIPPYGEDPWWQTFRRIGFTVSALIASDIYLLIAAFQYFNARKIAQMDVFKEHSWDITHGFFVLMGGFALCKPSERDTMQLDAAELCSLIGSRKLDFPHISEQGVHDRSKADWVSKTAASIQIFWFTLQVFARLVNRLPVTKLEVFTVGFTVMANAAYAFWLKKPFCVGVPNILHERPDAPRIPSDVPTSQYYHHYVSIENRGHVHSLLHPVALLWNASWGSYIEFLEEDVGIQYPPPNGRLLSTVCVILYPFFCFFAAAVAIFTQLRRNIWHFQPVGASSQDRLVIVTCLLVAPTISGLIHCAAWSSQFPTFIEQSLWRVLSLVITCCPLLEASTFAIVAIFDFSSLPKIVEDALEQLSLIIFGIIILILYAVSRLILLVLAFTTLRAFPRDAYKAVSWVELIPHV
ncbi:uncharacterized protein LAESUDRAFT_660258, partial [Laetiporus sulphureus 93-53]